MMEAKRKLGRKDRAERTEKRTRVTVTEREGERTGGQLALLWPFV